MPTEQRDNRGGYVFIAAREIRGNNFVVPAGTQISGIDSIPLERTRSPWAWELDELTAAVATRRDPNIANRIDHWLKTGWPELYAISGLWFTGSNVWRHLYGETPKSDSDLDIVAVDEEAKVKVRNWAGAKANAAKPPPDGKRMTSLGGERFYTRLGSLDLWLNTNPIQAIRDYPATHSHARVIYNPESKCLVVLPNEASEPGL